MKISEMITDRYKLRIPPTVYYDLLADVQELEEEQEPTTKNDLGVDCISRKFMYELGATCIATRNEDGKLIALGAIEELPPVTPQPCDDAVSRKDVHDMLENLPITVGDKWFNWLQKACNRLAELPSVTPQEPQAFRWCTDCREYDQEKHCCHRWSKVIRNTVEEMKQEPVLDKIREQMKDYLRGVEITLEVLVENDPLRPKMEGAEDTLKECLELIDKAETEG